jgi:hypothetical protein
VDRAEEWAQEYLERRFRGQGRVVHEPDGNVPPDFVIDGRVAVEVRRLSEHERGENPRPLMQTEIPFQKRLRAIAASVCSPCSHTLLVYVEYSRPLPSSKALAAGARPFLEALAASADPEGMSRRVTPTVFMKCLTAQPVRDRPFRFGWVDLNGGGTPMLMLQRNLRLCVEDKSDKTAAFRQKYPEWWLVLVNDVPFGLSECAREDAAEWLAMEHDWDEIVLIDWADNSQSFELSRLGSVQQALQPDAQPSAVDCES